MRIAILTLTALILAALPAGAQTTAAPLPCKPPKIPVSKAFKPFLPSCITRDRATNTYNCACAVAECNRFKNDLDDYNADIAEFVAALNIYVAEAGKFAQCKVAEINRENEN